MSTNRAWISWNAALYVPNADQAERDTINNQGNESNRGNEKFVDENAGPKLKNNSGGCRNEFQSVDRPRLPVSTSSLGHTENRRKTMAETISAGAEGSPYPIIAVDDKTLQNLSDQLLNISGTIPLHARFRALFTLKSICVPPFSSSTSSFVVHTLAAGFASDRTSALLRHELAYVLGQIGSPLAIPILEKILSDVQGQEEMVRHEAAEALAAIGSTNSIPLLRKFATEGGRGGTDDGRIVRETCEIALAKIEWNQSEEAQTARAEGELLDRYVSIFSCKVLFSS